jgi:3-hydroxybutyryl-CoA dehydrogenase
MKITSIAVAGAGTMGSGIALVSALNGFDTVLFDLNGEVLDRAKETTRNTLQILLDKQKITTVEKEDTFQRIRFTTDISECKAAVIIEAIIEKLSAKTKLFNELATFNDPDTIFATNTSSLSVSAIQAAIINPGRVVGMHFFNPATLMKLVEVVQGDQTTEASVQAVYECCLRMNKTPVVCKDAPGFIVNRVARHYYLEAMNLVENGTMGYEKVDALMEDIGFKMGPFKLMDLIGMDINLAVSKSLYDAFNQAERFRPSQIQIDKVANGELGRKTGQGFYKY